MVTKYNIILLVYESNLFPRLQKRVWWISIGRFVLLTPRFWELLIGVNNYKGHPLNDVPLSRAQKSNAHAIKEHR